MPPNHHHHTEYAPPVLRAPSPTSSVGTAYGADQTSFSDSEYQISQAAFEEKWEARIGLHSPRSEEERANIGPLLKRPDTGSPEELTLFYSGAFYQNLTNLRSRVQELEDNEIFEQTLLKGSQAGQEQQPSTNDIDALMRSMMVVPASSSARQQYSWPNTADATTNGYGPHAADTSMLNSGAKVGKRSRNGTTRNT